MRGIQRGICLLFLLAAAGGPVRAQLGLITCQATAEPAMVRANGVAEVVGDIVLTCRSPSIPGGLGDSVTTNISVSLNANITNNVDFGSGADLTDAVLIINENHCTTPASVGQAYACGSNPNVQDPQLGTLAATSRLEWNTLDFPVPGASFPGGQHLTETTIRITGIRAYAASLQPFGTLFTDDRLQAFVSISGPVTIPVTNNVLDVGIPVKELERGVSAVIDGKLGVDFYEGSTSFFRPQGAPSFGPGGSSSESIYFVPGSNNGGGASAGTRLIARIFNADGSVSVPNRIQLGSASLRGDALDLAIVPGADPEGAGGSPDLTPGEHPVVLSGGYGTFTYEVLDANEAKQESAVVPLTVSNFPSFSQISADLGPATTVVVASAAAPEPRFLWIDDPSPLPSPPTLVKSVEARIETFPPDDDGEFQVTIDGALAAEGPAGADGSTSVSKGATVSVEVMEKSGTSINDYSTKITCASGGLIKPVTATFDDTAPSPRSLSLTVPKAGNIPVDCVVENRNTSGPSVFTTLQAQLELLPDGDGGQFEGLIVGGASLFSGGDGADGSAQVQQGDTVTVQQNAVTGTTLTDYGTEIYCSGGGLPYAAVATFGSGDPSTRSLQFNVPDGDGTPIVCSFRNRLGGAPPPPVAPVSSVLTTCIASSAPATVRAEGLTELLGSFLLTCTNAGDAEPTADTILATLSLSLNTEITNNIDFGEGADVTDAVLVINDNHCITPAAVGSEFSCGSSAFQAPQYGRLAAANRIEWSNVSIPVPNALPPGGGPRNPATTTIRFVGLRSNVAGLGLTEPGAALGSTQVTAILGMSRSSGLTVNDGQLNLGTPALGLTSFLPDAASLVLEEGYPTAFKTKAPPSATPGGAPSEAGYFAPGSNDGGGAVAGTRFLIRFSGLDPAAAVSIPFQIDLGSPSMANDGLHAAIVPDADADGVGGTPTASSGEHAVPLNGGEGFAVYEILDTDPSAAEQLPIPLTFVSGALAEGTVTATFAAVSAAMEASGPAPEPRFIDNPNTTGPPGDPVLEKTVNLTLDVDSGPQAGEFAVFVDGAPAISGGDGTTGSVIVQPGAMVTVELRDGTMTALADFTSQIVCSDGGLAEPLAKAFPTSAPSPRTFSFRAPSIDAAPVDCVLANDHESTLGTSTLNVELDVVPSDDAGSFEIEVDGDPIASGGGGASGSTTAGQGSGVLISVMAAPGTDLSNYGTDVVCSGGGLGAPYEMSFGPEAGSPRTLQLPIPVGDGSPILCAVSNFAVDDPPVIPNFTTSCQATAVPPVIRAEGIAEQTGDIVLICETAGGVPNIDTLVGNLSVSLNVETTNNIDFGEGATVTDAVLVVNENNCTTPSAVGSSFGCGPDPRFQAPQYGTLADDNRIEWNGFSFPVPGGQPDTGDPFPSVSTIRITGIRANAATLGVAGAATFPFTVVTATVAFGGSTPIPITNNVLDLAVPILGLLTEVETPSTNQMEITLSEGFATSFKTQGIATFTRGVTQWESSYYAPGSNGGASASSGTRFRLRLLGFDLGAMLSLPRQLDLGAPDVSFDGLHIAMVPGADLAGAGGSPTDLTGDETITLTDGYGFVVYEVLDSNPFRNEEIAVPITLLNGELGESAAVAASFAPVSSIFEASGSEVEPRFQEGVAATGPPGSPLILRVGVERPWQTIGEPLNITAEIIDVDPGVAQASVRIVDEDGLERTATLTQAGGALFQAAVPTAGWREGQYEIYFEATDADSPPNTAVSTDPVEFQALCLVSLPDREESFPPEGGSHSYSFFISPGCTFDPRPTPDWITRTVQPTADPFEWTVQYSVEPNPTAEPRSATLQIWATRNLTLFTWNHEVTQAGTVASKTGTYSGGIWRLDTNGNGVFEPGTDRSFALGFPGAQHFVGDWDGDGRDQSGVYADGFWFLDFNGDDVWDGGIVDKQFPFGFAGATPVVGDWNGDGATDVGVYSNGFWFLDGNGDMLWDGGVEDVQFGFGWPGVEILVGDWNGDGRDKVGVFSSGFWFLDYDGDYQWDGGTVDRAYGWGWSGVKPIVGDWNGDGRDKAGAWINGVWVLDYDGDASWDGGTTDRIYGWGASNSTPVIGDWNNDGADSAGAFLDGEWVLDVDGDALWDGGTVDQLFDWGAAGDQPVVGRW